MRQLGHSESYLFFSCRFATTTRWSCCARWCRPLLPRTAFYSERDFWLGNSTHTRCAPGGGGWCGHGSGGCLPWPLALDLPTPGGSAPWRICRAKARRRLAEQIARFGWNSLPASRTVLNAQLRRPRARPRWCRSSLAQLRGQTIFEFADAGGGYRADCAGFTSGAARTSSSSCADHGRRCASGGLSTRSVATTVGVSPARCRGSPMTFDVVVVAVGTNPIAILLRTF